MRACQLGILTLVLLFTVFSQANQQHVRVRILRSFQPISLQANSLSSPQFSTTASPLQRGHFLFKRVLRNRLWQWQVTDKKSKKSFYISNSEIDLRGDFVEANYQTKIPSDFKLVGKKSRADLVAYLPMEDYLVGVLPNEMPLAWPEEALKAQAVASRSYTLSVIKERKHLHFDVDSSTQDQVFSWFQLSNLPPLFKNKIKSVLQETRGEFLVHGNEKNFKAYFHADSGGRTELAKFVWGPGITQPSFSVNTAYSFSPNKTWQKKWSHQQIANWLEVSVDSLKGIRVLSRTPSGRVKKVSIQINGNSVILGGNEFRKRLGYSRLKSTWFEISKHKDKFVFTGSGFGHGVGLCQWGARHLAKQGYGYQDILNYYYPKTAMKKFSTTQVAFNN